MSMNSQYGENVRSQIKSKKVSIKIMESKYEKLEQMFRDMWRAIYAGKKKQSGEGLAASGGSIYEFSECQKIEEKVQEVNMEKIRLPIISIDCIAKYEIQYHEEESKKENL